MGVLAGRVMSLPKGLLQCSLYELATVWPRFEKSPSLRLITNSDYVWVTTFLMGTVSYNQIGIVKMFCLITEKKGTYRKKVFKKIELNRKCSSFEMFCLSNWKGLGYSFETLPVSIFWRLVSARRSAYGIEFAGQLNLPRIALHAPGKPDARLHLRA